MAQNFKLTPKADNSALDAASGALKDTVVHITTSLGNLNDPIKLVETNLKKMGEGLTTLGKSFTKEVLSVSAGIKIAERTPVKDDTLVNAVRNSTSTYVDSANKTMAAFKSAISGASVGINTSKTGVTTTTTTTTTTATQTNSQFSLLIAATKSLTQAFLDLLVAVHHATAAIQPPTTQPYGPPSPGVRGGAQWVPTAQHAPPIAQIAPPLMPIAQHAPPLAAIAPPVANFATRRTRSQSKPIGNLAPPQATVAPPTAQIAPPIPTEQEIPWLWTPPTSSLPKTPSINSPTTPPSNSPTGNLKASHKKLMKANDNQQSEPQIIGEGGGGGGGGLAAALGPAAIAAGVFAIGLGEVIGSIKNLVGGIHEWVGALSPVAPQLFEQGLRDLQATLGTAVLPAFNMMAGVFRSAGDIIAPLMEKLQGPITAIASVLTGALLTVLQSAVSVFTSLLGPLTPLVEIFHSISNVLVGAVGSSFKMIGSLIQTLAPLFKALVEVLAVTTAIGMAPLVALAGVFNVLMAGINLVLIPVYALIDAFSGIFDIIVELGKVFMDVTSAIADGIGGVVGEMMSALKPFIDGFKEVFGALSDSIQVSGVVIVTVFQVLGDAFKSLVGDIKDAGSFKDMMKEWAAGIRNFVSQLILFIAKIAMAFGQMDFVNRLIANMKGEAKPQGGHAVAAMQDVGIKGFEQIAKDIQLAAAQAAGGAQGATPEEQANKMREDMVKQLEALVAQGLDQQFLVQIAEYLKTGNGILTDTKKIVDDILTFMRNPAAGIQNLVFPNDALGGAQGAAAQGAAALGQAAQGAQLAGNILGFQ